MSESETWWPAFEIFLNYARLRREPVDHVALRTIFERYASRAPQALIKAICREFGLEKAQYLNKADPAKCPFLIKEGAAWSIVLGKTPQGQWVTRVWDYTAHEVTEIARDDFETGALVVRLAFRPKFRMSQSKSLTMVLQAFFAEKRALFDLILGTVAISALALATSFYTMQVYDRVVPTAAQSTLLVLTLGVLVAVFLETVGKWNRARVIHTITDQIDQRMARSVFSRFLGLRMDQMPSDVGAMAQRVRGYESARGFLVALASHAIADLPMAFAITFVLWTIGGPIAFIPGAFLIFGILMGLLFRKRYEQLAAKATPIHNQRTGHLVESIEGAEIIKSGNGGWRMLSRWLDLSDEARHYDLSLRYLTERSQFVITMFQQTSYVAVIASGAILASQGLLSMGGLIACSILSGRIMAPAATIPGLIMQWGTARSALHDLDHLWALEQDHSEEATTVYMDEIKGDYALSGIEMSYGEILALKLDRLAFQAGERVALIGTIGSGKSSLLRILSGMYHPQRGLVQIGGVGIDRIDRTILSEHIGFIPQDGRLFQGSLRDNLIIGLKDPGEAAIQEAAKASGLWQNVIAPHPKGLERPILEGGRGLSGGQRQLVHLTRAMLKNPSIWLLDEPTASMDQMTELQTVKVFGQYMEKRPDATFIFVTHKAQIVDLADRIIVLSAGRILMDGPRAEVLERLRQHSAEQRGKAASNVRQLNG